MIVHRADGNLKDAMELKQDHAGWHLDPSPIGGFDSRSVTLNRRISGKGDQALVALPLSVRPAK